jgi:hypothetical protein
MAGICFVIMGFGRKTDYADAPRTLDLDAGYHAIIKPAVEACDLRCIRADEITHAGIIDRPMYEMLFRADLVIADISTANPNAIYELGVRHALRPYSTIVIKEIEGKFHFDLNHLATLQYKHLGEDIGAREAAGKRTDLERLIRAVMAEPRIDSPVHTFLTGAPWMSPRMPEDPLGRAPSLTSDEVERQVRSIETYGDSLSHAIEAGRRAAAAGNPAEAWSHFAHAHDAQKRRREETSGAGAAGADPYIVQQLALFTYKAKLPSEREALDRAWQILQELRPDLSTDPETLGIAGAIQKRLWKQTGATRYLDGAIESYGRGFEVKRDYYNGENFALCLDLRAPTQSDPLEATWDRMTARKARVRIVQGLEDAFRDPTTRDRVDYKWMLATMAGTKTALGDARAAIEWEQQFRSVSPPPAPWEIETFEEGKAYASKLAADRGS